MKALVTGGNGFIGSFLVEKLLKEGISVRCLVRQTSNLRWLKNLPIEWIYGDLADQAALAKAVADVHYIFHVAGVIKASTRDKFFSANCTGTMNLARAALAHAPKLQRFVFVSSVAATGPVEGSLPPTEDSRCQPVSDYGKSKWEAEEQLKVIGRDLPLTIIRPPIVYGPRDEHFLIFFKFAKRGVFFVPAPYQRYYSIIHVEDLVNGIYLASQNMEALGKTYFIANSEVYSFESMAHQVCRLFSRQPKFIHVPRFAVRVVGWVGDMVGWLTRKDVFINSKKIPELEAASWICSSEKARRELGFRAKMPLSAGFDHAIAWFRKNNYL